MWRTPRGVVVHAHAACPHVARRSRLVRVSRNDVRNGVALCRRCHGTCLVCMCERGFRMPCAHDHFVCDACMMRHASATRVWPTCPCGASRKPLLTGEHLTDAHAAALATALSSREAPQVAAAPALVSVKVDTDVLTPKCPACGAAYVDFDACAALVCHACASVFCALCDRVCANMDDGHAHVAACAHNPTPGSYYVPLDAWRRVRASTTRRRVWAALGALAARDPLCALIGARRLCAADAETMLWGAFRAWWWWWWYACVAAATVCVCVCEVA